MAKANLTYKSERLLGEFLPTIYFKSILVASTEDADSVEDRSNLKVMVDASIGFTKPDNMTITEAETFIEKTWPDLYLYSWISPFQDINVSLENLNFKIFDLYKQIYNLEYPSINNFTVSHLLYNDFKEFTWQHYLDSESAHGASVLSPAELIASILDSSAGAIGGMINIDGAEFGETDASVFMLGPMARDANLSVFLLWCVLQAIKTDPETAATFATVPEAASLFSLSEQENAVSYCVFGENRAGPWNKPDTVFVDGYRSAIIATFLAMGVVDEPELSEFSTEELTAAFSAAEATTAAAFTDAHPSGYITTLKDKLGAFGVEVSPTSLRTNSYVYEYFEQILDSFSYDMIELSSAIIQRKKISLADLISPDNEYGAKLQFNKTFDSDNQEIFKITNIKLNFPYHSEVPGTANPSSYATDYMNEVKKLFLIAAVGIDIDKITSDLEDAEYIYQGTSIRNMMNNYFGNITFEEIMKSGVVPRAYFEHYVYSETSAPFDGVPIRGLNGKLYDDSVINRPTIIAAYEKLISKYKAEKDVSGRLNKNLNNLEIILIKDKNSPELIQKIKRYQKTYTDRMPSTPSGRFYIDFRDIMLKLNKRITTQKTVERRISLNSIIMDIRPQRAIGEIYQPIESNTLNHLMGSGMGVMPYYTVGDAMPVGGTPLGENRRSDYISGEKATKLVRNLEFMQLGDDLIKNSELSGLRDYSVASLVEYMGFLEDSVEDGDLLFGDGSGAAAGVGPDEIEAAVAELLEDEADRILEYSGVDVTKVNMIGKNAGYFFFDHEKAVHTQSHMSKMVDLRKLSVFLNISIPYEYFRLTSVTMTRNDLSLTFPYGGTDTPAFAIEDVYPHMVKTTLTTYFAQNENIPRITWTVHEVLPGTEVDFESKSHYGKGEVELTTATGDPLKKDYSCIKYVFYDIARNSEPLRHHHGGVVGSDPHSPFAPYRYTPCLKDFGSAEGWPTLTPGYKGHEVSYIRTDGIGQPHLFKKSKSYRLMGFEFVDYMDDDVSIMNSQTSLLGLVDVESKTTPREARHMALSTVNPYGEPNSWYDITITVEDRSIEYFYSIYADVINPILEAFKEYADYAEELCSYNTSVEEFNQFFVDAMVDKYITEPSRTFLSEFGSVEGSLRMMNTTETMVGAGISDNLNSDFSADLAGMVNIPEYVKTFPPWVAGAILMSFVKEIFFNPTPQKELFAVYYDIVNAFSSYDPAHGPPDPETLKFIKEMYSLTPQKGNLPAISSFLERLDPLVDIFRLNNSGIRERVSDLTGISLEDPDFLDKVTGPEGYNTLQFRSTKQINVPMSPGISRFYADSSADAYVFADSGMPYMVGDGSDVAGGDSDTGGSIAYYYGIDTLSIDDAHHLREYQAFRNRIREHQSEGTYQNTIMGWLAETHASEATNWVIHGETRTRQWLKENIPDYSSWQLRAKSVGKGVPEGVVDGLSTQRIYMPVKYNDPRMISLADVEFEGGTELPTEGISFEWATDSAAAEMLRFTTHLKVNDWEFGDDGMPYPKSGFWVWYPDPNVEGYKEASAESVAFPGSAGAGYDYPSDD